MTPTDVASPRPSRRNTSRAEEMASLRAQGLSLQAIADLMGLSRERVRQILVASNKKLDQSYLIQTRRERHLERAQAKADELLTGFRAARPLRELAAQLELTRLAATEVLKTIATSADRAERRRNSGRRARGPTYTDEELLAAIRRAADELGAVPSSLGYQRLAQRLGLPSLPTISNRLGGWAEAVRRAGMTPHEGRRTYTRTWHEEACWAALKRLVEELGQVPTMQHYAALATTRADLPSPATVRNRLGRWSEVAARLASAPDN